MRTSDACLNFSSSSMPQNAELIVLCLRLTNGNTALARWIGDVKAGMAKCKVLAPLLAAEAMEDQFDIGGSQRRVA